MNAPHRPIVLGAALALLTLLTILTMAGGDAARSAEAPRARLGPLAERPRGGGRIDLSLKPPVARIGLTGDGRTVSLDSAGGLYIVDRQNGRDVWKHIHKGPVRVVLERGGAPDAAAIFSV